MRSYLRKYGNGFEQNARLTLFKKVQLKDFSGRIAQPLLGKAIKKYEQAVWLWDFQMKLSRVLLTFA
jgi:hypothetical protein